jgi:hypothetical protein
MSMRQNVQSLILAAAVSLPIAGLAQAQTTDQEYAETYETVKEAMLPTMVRVKVVMSMESPWGGEPEEEEMEVGGLLISADGQVLLTNSMMGGLYGMMGGFQMTPRDIKVLIGDDTEGLSATLVARDSDRDLCWIKLDEEPEEALPYLDLESEAVRPAVGQMVYQVKRLGEFFDRAPVINEARVTAEIQKPRELLYVSTGSVEVGSAVVDAEGNFAGMVVTQLPGSDELEAAGGFGSNFSDSYIWAILPPAEVAKATRDAMSLLEEEE